MGLRRLRGAGSGMDECFQTGTTRNGLSSESEQSSSGGRQCLQNAAELCEDRTANDFSAASPVPVKQTTGSAELLSGKPVLHSDVNIRTVWQSQTDPSVWKIPS